MPGIESIENVGTTDVTASPVHSPRESARLPEETGADAEIPEGAEAATENGSLETALQQRSFKVETDLSPLTVTDNMHLSQLHFMFVMTMPTHAFVISRGRLAGVVRRRDFIFTGFTDCKA